MSGQGISKAVGEYLAGNLAGQRMVAELREGQGEPDHLYHFLKSHCPQLNGDYVRGLLRSLQKVIEREGGGV